MSMPLYDMSKENITMIQLNITYILKDIIL